MMLGKFVTAGMLSSLLVAGAAFAQTPAPAASPPAPATAPAPAMDKQAISKACSAEADKQMMKGKARKAFRSKCKHEKMKAM